jgi:HK97 family phage prohead protease
MEIKHIDVPFELKQMDEDSEFFFFEGIGATGDIDRGADKIIPGASAESLAAMTPALFYAHNAEMPLGIYTSAVEDSEGRILVKAKMPKEDDFVSKRIVPQMKIGSISSLSIGFTIEPGGAEFVNGIRLLKKIKIWEISLVTIPMNENAVVTSIKSASFQNLPLADAGQTWDAAAATARVLEFTGSGDTPNDNYKKCFFQCNTGNPNEFGSYGLPFVDVIDGELKAIPRAIFAAAVSGKGSGHADVTGHIEQYYKKMGRETPFSEKQCFRVDDLESFTEREFEQLLKSGITMTGSMAKTAVAMLRGKLYRDGDDESTRDAKRKAEEAAQAEAKQLAEIAELFKKEL